MDIRERIKEKLNEAVQFDYTVYVRSHGKPPKGRGHWAFSVNPEGTEPIFAPAMMTLEEAKQWAKRQPELERARVIYILP